MREGRLENGGVYALQKPDFDGLLKELHQRGYQTLGARIENENLVYGPIEALDDLPQGCSTEQEAGQFRILRPGHDRYFDYIPGAHTWKQFLFPPRTELFRLRMDDGWRIETLPEKQDKFAFIGVRGCELRAIQIQDGIFLREDFSDPLYGRRRQNLFVLAVNCLHPAATCFCTSLGCGPEVEAGFDLLVTELEDHFLIEIGSEMGQEVLNGLPLQPASAFLTQNAQKGLAQAAREIHRQLNTSDLPGLLLENLDHPHWYRIAERCLSCGNCTQVCPTCFCWDTVDSSSLNGKETRRERVWDSCFNPGFSYQAGGNTRPTIHSRYRQWLSHKLGTWQGQFGGLGCTGCGRCIVWCPAGIDLTEEVPQFRKVNKQ